MRHLMRHDVRAQAREDQPTGIIRSLRLVRRGEITEKHRLFLRVLVSIRIPQRVRVDAPLGKGRVLLFGPQILQRAQPHGTFKFLFNSIVQAGVRAPLN